MSDSQYRANLGHKLDIIDDDWAADTLSDDEIELPPEVDPVPDENEIDSLELAESRKKEEERWTDLALDSFDGEQR
jgi:hypothetical protein